jgi:outer membrane cobalamin receptor
VHSLFLALTAAAAEPPVRSIEELSLDDILDLSVAVTRDHVSARRAPGLVSVLTGDDLRRAGCRDLADALALVASLSFGADVWQTLGLGVRGNWANEGKALVRIDGHEWNEGAYGSFTLGPNRLPAAAIDRIEIIRGPGSAVYGGFASLAVIDVITRAGSGETGSDAELRLSWLGSGETGSQAAVVNSGVDLPSGGRLGMTAAFGQSRRSSEVYVAPNGDAVDLGDVSESNPSLLSFDLRTGATRLAVFGEWYGTTQTTNYGEIAAPNESDFPQLSARLGTSVPVGGQWRIEPRLQLHVQQPWRAIIGVPVALQSPDVVSRQLAGVDAVGPLGAAADLRLGAELGRDAIRQFNAAYFVGDDARTAFLRAAAWAEAQAEWRGFSATAGLRLDVNSAYGAAVSPRVAVTRSWDRAHVKALYGRAFHAPAFYQAASGMRPELSDTLEAEVGAALRPWLYVTASAFRVRVARTFVYTVEVDPVTGGAIEGYVDVGSTGTDGAEASIDARTGGFAGNLAVIGQAANEGTADAYSVRAAPNAHVGLPNVRGVARASQTVGAFTFGGVVGVMGPRWSKAGNGTPRDTRLPTAATLDLSTSVRPHPAFDLAIDVHDLFDTALPSVQPYDGGHAPLPSAGREIGLRWTGRW